MIQSKRVLAFIPARGGSKGIKDKNIHPLGNKPLISYSIASARESVYIDAVIVSTDSQVIAEAALEYGAEVPFLRPAALATDTSKIIDAVLHAVDFLAEKGRQFDILVLLQPTQPLRTTQDIDRALEAFLKNGEQSLCSVHPVTDSPLLIRSLSSEGRLSPLLDTGSTVRRQDMPSYYRVNGAVYIHTIRELTPQTSFNDSRIPFFMEAAHSLDIDSMEDMLIAEAFLPYCAQANGKIMEME